MFLRIIIFAYISAKNLLFLPEITFVIINKAFCVT